jgi:DNA-binding CsgD family transcriptional regulator
MNHISMNHSMTARTQTELAFREAQLELDVVELDAVKIDAVEMEVPAEVRNLVRLLVRQTDPDYRAASTLCKVDAPAEAVLLDIEIDGARYLLIRSSQSAARGQEILSPREQEIAHMVSRGYANKTIAAVLDISCWTVGTHLRRIFAKLGVSTRAAMVARLLEDGQDFDHAASHRYSLPDR